MGNAFVVSSWEKLSDGRYAYREVYRGEDFTQALYVMASEKSDGAGCVKLEWRGDPADKDLTKAGR
jgi:hypothetical protein